MRTAAVQIPGGRYDTSAVRIRMYDQVLERVKAIPGVRTAVITSAVPTRVLSSNGLTIEGRDWTGENTMPFIPYQTVSDEYFRAMGIPLKRGRTFGAQDHADAPGAIVVNETMARKFWPTGDAIGAHIRLGPNLTSPWLTIVGVVADVRAKADDPRPEPHAYATIRQNPYYPMMLAVRTTGEPLNYVRPVQQALWSVDRNLPLHHAESLESLLADGMAPRRLPAVLMTAFGALALLLASVGVYAMFASMAAAREREFGVRVALGSTPRRIATLVLRQGALWMALGLAGGVLGVMLVARLLQNLLYGVEPFDPMALGAAVLLLLASALVALLGPVRRATRVDPITVLR
jgi:putative ABC transport system permease protein